MNTRSVLIVLFSTMPIVAHCAEPNESVQAIEKSWQTRQDSTKSLRIMWTTTVTTAKGGIDPDASIPPAGHQHEETGELVISGNKLRLDLRGRMYSMLTGQWEADDSVSVYDGKLASYSRNAVVDNHTRVTLDTDQLPLCTKLISISPIWAIYRPNQSPIRMVEIDIFRRTNRTATISGLLCEELTYRSPNGLVAWSLWVTVNDLRLPVRYLQEFSEGPESSIQRDIHYSVSNGEMGLDSWSIVTRDRKGAIAQSVSAKVTLLEVNTDAPLQTFDTSPPPRSIVSLNTDRQPVSKYLIRDDGVRQDLQIDNYEARFDELLNETAKPAGSQGIFRWLGFIIAGLIVGAFLLVFARYRFRAIKLSSN